MNVNFHHPFQLGQKDIALASALPGMLCIETIFSLLERLLPWNEHGFELAVKSLLTIR